MDPTPSFAAPSSISRLPRFTPRSGVPTPVRANVPLSTPLARFQSEFKPPRNPTVQALSLAIKKRYSTGKKVSRAAPLTMRQVPLKNGGPSRSGAVKRPAAEISSRGSKKPKILGENNTNVAVKRPAAGSTSDTNKATSSKKPIAKKRVTGAKSQENADAVAVPNSSNQAAPKRKVQPWDLKGKLELANETIRKLKGDVEILQNRVVELENLGGTAEERIANVSAQLAEEKALSSSRLEEIQDRDRRIARHREELVKLQERLDSQKETFELEKMKLNLTITELNKKVQDLQVDLTMYKTRCQDQAIEIDQLHDTRKILHNQVQDLKGNIRVLCRVRPPTDMEAKAASPLCHVQYNDQSSLELYKLKEEVNSKQKRVTGSFSFDRVFSAGSTQEDVYSELEQLVQSCLDGYNVCVFAYGQTGSGKTFTMDGLEDPASQRGMIPRTVETIFTKIDKLKKLGWEYNVEVFFVEIYNEQIHDLLNYNSGLSHEVRMVPNKKNDIFVTNLKVEPVSSQGELDDLMALARRNRFVASTVCNTHSSRSHFIMKMAVTGVNDKRQLSCSGSISLVDLAGSEKYEDNNSADRRKETTSINKSLSSLANVILSLKQKNEHVPYRVSKLTHLLMPSLGGSSKTLMIVNISPLRDCYSESVNSLRFANCVSQCHIVAKKNEKTVATL